MKKKLVIAGLLAFVGYCVYMNWPRSPDVIEKISPELMQIAHDYLIEDYADIRDKNLREKDADMERGKAEREFDERIERIVHTRKTFRRDIPPTERERTALDNFIKGEYKFANISDEDVEVIARYYFRDDAKWKEVRGK